MEKNIFKAPIFNIMLNERESFEKGKDEARRQRKEFVSNLGILLSQTREQIVGAELGDDEYVTVRYKDRGYKLICVEGDSWADIIRDVIKRI